MARGKRWLSAGRWLGLGQVGRGRGRGCRLGLAVSSAGLAKGFPLSLMRLGRAHWSGCWLKARSGVRWLMRCVELFAGAGGAALGLERAGLRHAALVEWDAAACATLRAAGLGPVVEGDVRDFAAVEAAWHGPPDVLWSSFPCQAWSTAGKRLGAADERNGWPWTVAALDRWRPRWFLGENVRGLLLHRGGCAFAGGQGGLFGAPDVTACPGCYFERIILPDLRARFAHVGWWLLDAADFGVPQHRRRVILWAGPRPLAEPTPTHGPGRAAPWVSMGEALGLRCGCFATHPEGAATVAERRVRELTGRPSPTIGATYSGDLAGQPWAYVLPFGVTGQGVASPLHAPSPTVTTKGTAYLVRPAPTVTAQEVRGTRGAGQSGGPDRASDALWLATGRRRLTVGECAVLQGFPADWPWQGTREAQYRQVGNAVPPALAEAVGRALVTVG